MNLLSFTDAENYLRNKQVFIVPEIADKDLKTQTKENTVYDIGEVEVTEIREDCVCLTLKINKKEISIYLEKTKLSFLAWIKTNFIPVKEMLYAYRNS